MLARGLNKTLIAYYIQQLLPQVVYNGLVKVIFMQLLFYLTIPFHWIERDIYMRFYAYHGYFWHWVTLLLLFVTFLSPRAPRKDSKKGEQKDLAAKNVADTKKEEEKTKETKKNL